MTKTGIIGASGYSGETLIRILLSHPHFELCLVSSRSLAGSNVEDAHPQFRGHQSNLTYQESDPDKILKENPDVECFFLALPHGVASTYARVFFDAGKRIIDLSADFRLNSTARYEEFYQSPHPDPDLLRESVYVVPELTSLESWKEKRLIACPGCYPTSILMPLYPLLKGKLLDGRNIVINSCSGVSGAGKKAGVFYSFSERNENACAYGSPKHRHLSEIEEQLSLAAEGSRIVQFTPHLIPATRGIMTTITVPSQGRKIEEIYEVWNDTFDHSPFVAILDSGQFPNTLHVGGTNRVDISAVKDSRTGNLVITSALDNLIKGASGQAVQILNILCQQPETTGLL